MTTKTVHRRGSRLFVPRANRYAATAMIAMMTRADAIEHGLHPRHPAEGDVQRAQAQDHQKRRENEREPNERRAHDAALEKSDRHGRLGGKRTGHDLRKRDRQVVGGLVDQLPILDEVASHVADKRRRAAETERSELEEIPDELFH